MELTVLSGMIFFIVAVQVASNEHSSIIIKQIIRFFFFKLTLINKCYA